MGQGQKSGQPSKLFIHHHCRLIDLRERYGLLSQHDAICFEVLGLLITKLQFSEKLHRFSHHRGFLVHGHHHWRAPSLLHKEQNAEGYHTGFELGLAEHLLYKWLSDNGIRRR